MSNSTASSGQYVLDAAGIAALINQMSVGKSKELDTTSKNMPPIIFDGSNMEEFRERWEDIVGVQDLTTDAVFKKIEFFVEREYREAVKGIPEFIAAQQGQTTEERWVSFWKALRIELGMGPEYTVTDLSKIYQGEEESAGNYIVRFTKISKALIAAKCITEEGIIPYFLAGIKKELRKETLREMRNRPETFLEATKSLKVIQAEAGKLDLAEKTKEGKVVNAVMKGKEVKKSEPDVDGMTEMFKKLVMLISAGQQQNTTGRNVPANLGSSTGPSNTSRQPYSGPFVCIYCDSAEHAKRDCAELTQAIVDRKVILNSKGQICRSDGTLIPVNFNRGGMKSYVDGNSGVVNHITVNVSKADSRMPVGNDVNVDVKRRQEDDEDGRGSTTRPKRGGDQVIEVVGTPIRELRKLGTPENTFTKEKKDKREGKKSVDFDTRMDVDGDIKNEKEKRRYKYEQEIDIFYNTEKLANCILETEIPVTIGALMGGMNQVRQHIVDKLKKKRTLIDLATGSMVETEIEVNELWTEKESGEFEVPISQRTVNAMRMNLDYQGLIAGATIHIEAAFNRLPGINVLVDEGSEINVVSEAFAIEAGFLVDTNVSWVMNGVVAGEGLVGYAPEVLIDVGGLQRKCAVFVSKSLNVTAILGRPWTLAVNLITDNRKGTTRVMLRDDPDDPYCKVVEFVAMRLNHHRNKYEEGPRGRQGEKVTPRLGSVETDDFRVRSILLNPEVGSGLKECEIKEIRRNEYEINGEQVKLDNGDEIMMVADFLDGRI